MNDDSLVDNADVIMDLMRARQRRLAAEFRQIRPQIRALPGLVSTEPVPVISTMQFYWEPGNIRFFVPNQGAQYHYWTSPAPEDTSYAPRLVLPEPSFKWPLVPDTPFGNYKAYTFEQKQRTHACPKCGGLVEALDETNKFCLDCDWDNLKPLPEN